MTNQAIPVRTTNDAECGFYINAEQGVAIDGEHSADVEVSQEVQGDTDEVHGGNEEEAEAQVPRAARAG